jgi:hypothetical protein
MRSEASLSHFHIGPLAARMRAVAKSDLCARACDQAGKMAQPSRGKLCLLISVLARKGHQDSKRRTFIASHT